jgi:hypothetical protein
MRTDGPGVPVTNFIRTYSFGRSGSKDYILHQSTNKKMCLSIRGIVVLLTLVSSTTFSQTTFHIWPGLAPGSENWQQKEQTVENTPVGTVILNVVTPALTVYLPEKTKANGTAMIIAPGGACIALVMKPADELAISFRIKISITGEKAGGNAAGSERGYRVSVWNCGCDPKYKICQGTCLPMGNFSC